MEERDAIARLKRGDIGGLEVLVRRYQAPALKAAFLRAYERIAQFDASRPFGPWFLRSVVNDTLKAVTRRRDVSLDATPVTDAAPLVSRAPDLDDLLAAAETKEAIWAALEQLTPAQRAAIVARYYLDLSDTETARRLDCPPGTVRRRLSDARQRLRRLLPAWVSQPAED